MPTIKVRVRGICCFVDRNNGAYAKRVVIPRDNLGMRGMSHIPFIEFEESDVVSWNGLEPAKSYTRRNGSVHYQRWNLDGHCVEFQSLDLDSPLLKTSDSFGKHVPKMKAICPQLRAYPRAECFEDDPPADLIAGCLEISRGSLDAGPLEEIFTAFTPKQDWGPERTPQWVELTLPVKPGTIRLTLDAFRNGDPKSAAEDAWIELREGTEVITVGNLLEEDISGAGSVNGRSEHFKIYYNLASEDTSMYDDLPVPAVAQIPTGACSPLSWK